MWRAFGVFLEGWATAAERRARRRARGHAPRRRAAARTERSVFRRAIEDRAGRGRSPGGRSRPRHRDPRRSAGDVPIALGYRAFEAELHRARGEILLKRDPANPAPAEEAFLTAIAVAKQQGTRSFELRAALSLAKLYQSTGRPADAHAVLAPALEGFSPTPEMPEIAEAQALLAALAETDEVKAEAAQRQRLTQLHVSYGNALIAARGYGAPETTEAFARARESASGDKDAPERLAADYGLWVGSFVRGELPSMRAHAAAFLSDVEARPNSPEAGVAHRAAGVDLLVRRRVSRGAGSFGTGARLVPTRPRRRSGLSLRTGPRRRRDGLSGDCVCGLSARSIARFRSSTACRRGSRTSPMSARSRLEECTRPYSN